MFANKSSLMTLAHSGETKNELVHKILLLFGCHNFFETNPQSGLNDPPFPLSTSSRPSNGWSFHLSTRFSPQKLHREKSFHSCYQIYCIYFFLLCVIFGISFCSSKVNHRRSGFSGRGGFGKIARGRNIFRH